MAVAEPPLSPQTPPWLLLSSHAVLPLLAMFAAAMSFSWASLRRPSLVPHAWYLTLGATGLAGGILILIPYEMTKVLSAPHVGLSNLYQVSIFTLLVTGTLALGFDRTGAPGKLLPFTTPILTAAAAFALWLTRVGAATPSELVPALQNAILPLHVAANFVGYGCFAIAAAAAAALLVRARADKLHRRSNLPPVAQLEVLAHRAVSLGFPVFSLAILLGSLWAYQAWGGYWSWDPKETWALIVWLIYAAYLHARPTWRGRPAFLAWWLLAGFGATLFCYIGVNMFLSGLHSYGTLAQ